MSDDSRKDLPPVTAPNFLDRLRETVMTYLGRQGDTLDRGVTLRDVQDVNLANVRAGFLSTGRGLVFAGLGSAVEPAYDIDLTPPPTPTGLTVSAGISKLIIDWDDPTFTQGHGYDRTIIYGATYSGTGPLPTFSSAVELTQAPGSVTAYATQPATEWHIWIKWQTKDGVLSISPAGSTNGVTATTGQDVSLLLNALTAAAENPLAPYTKYAVRAGLFYVASDTGPTDAPLFAVVTSPITVGGVTVPVGVYMADAFIMNGTITNAKIANLAVDNAKIAALAVDAAKIANATITTAKIGNAQITTALIANAAITTALIANAQITTALIANAQITTALIANAAVGNAQIANLAVDAAKIANATITNAKIGTAAVDTLQIAGNAVTVPVASELASSVAITAVNGTAGSGSMTSILSLSIDPASQPVLVTATCNCVSFGTDGVTSGKTGQVIAAIWVDGVRVKYGFMQSVGGPAANNGNSRITLTSYLASPGAGSHTIELRMHVWDGSIAAGVTYFANANGDLSVNSGNTLVAMGLKR